MADLEKLSNKELRQKCKDLGIANIPVTDSTRKLLIRKIQNCISGGESKKNVKRLANHKPAKSSTSNVKIAVNTKIRVRDDVAEKKKDTINLTRRSISDTKTKTNVKHTPKPLNNNSTVKIPTKDISPKSSYSSTQRISPLKGILKNKLSISQRPSENIISDSLHKRDYTNESLSANFGICHTMQPKLFKPQISKINTTVWPHNTSARTQVLTKTPVFCTSFIQESSIYRS
ncbi:LEM domain-containing protein Bocksbeutel-like [Musca vetustissima]|uniref:LEM domain-containing protein Bocksbeutel-like n=1 Tax=Musca vetustissima TaxID=27455 RepID=UPI002AB624F8|nr:LEM domain-containing protein Bocksbeutel-like [Musca vetustissima]